MNILATLRAAAPWQPLRKRERGPRARGLEIRRDDIHLTRFQQRRETLTLFVVDASGSAAMQRLAEAKGAVELLLADCYVRRDQVALIAFRDESAELLLPPTRSLVRAKKALAALPGGGATPMAAALDLARETVQNKGSPRITYCSLMAPQMWHATAPVTVRPVHAMPWPPRGHWQKTQLMGLSSTRRSARNRGPENSLTRSTAPTSPYPRPTQKH
ncbi:MAG: VWA domain-containing protein [Halieaceae bacterium]